MATRRRSRRSVRGDAAKTREKLVGAAAELFNEVGYHRTDSNRIARAAGFAAATFYHHFTDKREIFLATYERWVAVEWEAIRAELAGARRGSLARVTRLVLAHHQRWAVFRRSLLALAATDPVVAAVRVDQRRVQLRFMSELLERSEGTRPCPARCLLALLSFERVCDAIADGEVGGLGVSEPRLLRALREQLRAMV